MKLKTPNQINPVVVVEEEEKTVSMDEMANTLLAAVASPAMIHSIEEMPEFTHHARTLCIKISTISHYWLSAMELGVVANARFWIQSLLGL
ncbi:hypothetical protein Tsubulata_049569 [Turnera subulata]|uniref:hydroxyethylthiazole kinase n=1 Tax=Turnera subulata TaxID=218843 RepID=A0A9Q0J0A7_9ROSI|nr:hypothetical protein Tsubulata_049569 [Turnera subulata]